MSTRAGSAARSLRAKERLVRAMFGALQTNSKKKNHWTHQELKTEYLKRVQELHPDKHHHQKKTTCTKEKFVELQDAWNMYEDFVAKSMKHNSGKAAANFTMFGVGCSFSDSEYERALRNDIMDQAGRGWFRSGSLAETSSSGDSPPRVPKVSLSDDALFVTDDTEEETTTRTSRKSLVSHLIPPSKR